MIFFLFACVSQERFFTEYDISVRVTNPTPDVPHYVTLLHEWVGEEDLRYPMFPIEEGMFDGDRLESWLVLVEKDQGEGLALFVWEDVDSDGVFCSLEGQEERSGLVMLDSSELVSDTDIELSSLCMGFERLYGTLEN